MLDLQAAVEYVSERFVGPVSVVAASFSAEQQKLLSSQGFLVMDSEFEVGRVLFEEFGHYRPLNYFVASSAPALVAHGDQDSYVAYGLACAAASARGRCAFHTVTGSDHGLDSRAREDEAIEITADWLVNEHPEPA